VTVGKHFKKRVRERMEVTGESYTAARRALETTVTAVQKLGCMCGVKKCAYCSGSITNVPCVHMSTELPLASVRCPHCGYPTQSTKIGQP
jgi:hypothetical protein